MKKSLFLLFILFITTTAFAQVHRAQRVLSYVPDNCYSVQTMDLDKVARNMELKALYSDKHLDWILDEFKPAKTFIQSWVNRDSKLGVDFTATMAIVDNNIFIIPLNDEKKFEKVIKSMLNSKASFKNYSDKARILVSEESAVICNDDVACLLIYATDELAAFFSSDPKMSVETVWQNMNNSQFLSTEAGQKLLSGEIDSYTLYNSQNFMLMNLVYYLKSMAPNVSEDLLNNIDVEIFSKAKVERNSITGIAEFRDRSNLISDVDRAKMKLDPESVSELLPYLGDRPLFMGFSSMTGYDKIQETPVKMSSEYQALLPLMGKPLAYTLLDEGDLLFATFVDDKTQVSQILKDYVTAHNRQVDSLFKVRSEEPAVEPDWENFDGDDTELRLEMMEQIMLNQQSVDPSVNKKSVEYIPNSDMDIYAILTTKSVMNYDTYTQELALDTSYVVVKDKKLFYTKKTSTFDFIRRPAGKPNAFSEDWLQHSFFMRFDMERLMDMVAASGLEDFNFPLDDFTMSMDGNILTTNLKGVKGLDHGLCYELFRSFSDIIKMIGTGRASN